MGIELITLIVLEVAAVFFWIGWEMKTLFVQRSKDREEDTEEQAEWDPCTVVDDFYDERG